MKIEICAPVIERQYPEDEFGQLDTSEFECPCCGAPCCVLESIVLNKTDSCAAFEKLGHEGFGLVTRLSMRCAGGDTWNYFMGVWRGRTCCWCEVSERGAKSVLK